MIEKGMLVCKPLLTPTRRKKIINCFNIVYSKNKNKVTLETSKN